MPTALIIDDDDEIAGVLAAMLELMNWETKTAPDVRVANQILSGFVPDLILVDQFMPVATGIEVAQSLRRDPRTRDVPILMLSADGLSQSRDAARLAGVKEYLVKPISFEELQAAVRRVVVSDY